MPPTREERRNLADITSVQWPASNRVAGFKSEDLAGFVGMPEASNWSCVTDRHPNLARDQFEAGLNEDAWRGPRSFSTRTYRWLWALKLGHDRCEWMSWSMG